MNKNESENKKNANIRIRPATPEDLKELVKFCRESFPDALRWQGVYPIGVQWWRSVLQSKSVQICVVEDEKGIFALNVLILDLLLWSKEAKIRNGCLAFRILSIIFCPVSAIWKRLWKIVNSQSNKRKNIKYDLKKQYSDKIAWSEMTAVLPRMQGKGYGKLIIQSHDQRAAAAGATVIKNLISQDNISSKHLHEKMGYRFSVEVPHGFIYSKTLIKKPEKDD